MRSLEAKEVVLAAIADRQELFPRSLVEAIGWTKIDQDNIEAEVARMTLTFPPVFLPIFEAEGDVFAEHLHPGTRREACAWFRLPHDETEPFLVASRLVYLPRLLARPPLCMRNEVHVVWQAALEMSQRIGATAPPPEARYQALASRLSAEFTAELDPGNGASHVTAAVNAAGWTDESAARRAIEVLLSVYPGDAHVVAAAAMARSADMDESATPLARRVFDAEIRHGFVGAARHFVGQLVSPAAILENMRGILAVSSHEMGVLEPLRTQSVLDLRGSAALRGIARAFRGGSNHPAALTCLRNAAWVAGARAAIDRRLCEELAEQTFSIEGNGLSVAIASLAASVVSRGP
jgi:hypothetical protein